MKRILLAVSLLSLTPHVASAEPKATKTATPSKGKTNASESSSDGGQSGGVVNVKTATAEQLALLPGVGDKLAEHIVEARTAHPDLSCSTLGKVKGIGEAKLAKIKPFCVDSGETTLTSEVSKSGNKSSTAKW